MTTLFFLLALINVNIQAFVKEKNIYYTLYRAIVHYGSLYAEVYITKLNGKLSEYDLLYIKI